VKDKERLLSVLGMKRSITLKEEPCVRVKEGCDGGERIGVSMSF
jgi:hypothetical protein